MFKLLGWLHLKLYQAVLWLLGLPFKALWSFLLAVLALLGEELRRWAGIAMFGLLVFLAGKATLSYAPMPVKKPLVLAELALVAVWSLVAFRAARYTMSNNLRLVRQRMYFRSLIGEVRDIRGRFTDGLARAAHGTPVGGVFKSNREKDARAEAQARAAQQRAAEQAARDIEQAALDAEQAAAGFYLDDGIPNPQR